ncbi:MAG: IS200/IS605 family transposase [Saprospiraceae bacterium]|nr:IS200/IS605 family transposase [Saprospiraceae bacterium]
MANTFTKLYAHIVFSPKGREGYIIPEIEERVYKYMTGILKEKGQTPIAINGMPDHVHVLIGYKPINALSDLVRDLKSSTSKFINENKLLRGTFSWQEGFGGFSVSHSQVNTVAKYIQLQKIHHKEKSFREEYMELLQTTEIPFDEAYIFDDAHAV